MSLFRLAQREQVPVRIALTGPTNAGKTYSALLLAQGILKGKFPEMTDEDLYKKIVFIDTERRRGLLYADRKDLPFPTNQFMYLEIEAPYHPGKLIDTINNAVKEFGTDIVIIVDSLSHFWSYEGGVLDIKAQLDKKGGNSYANWAEPSSLHNKMIDALFANQVNMIATMRSKTEYALEENEKGKLAPKKLGLKPMQRDDTEFEFDTTLMLDAHHTATIIKDVTFLRELADETYAIGKIIPELGTRLYQFLNNAEDPDKFKQEDLLVQQNKIKELVQDPDLLVLFKALFPKTKVTDMDLNQIKNAVFELERAKNIKGA